MGNQAVTKELAEETGFEPAMSCPIHAFQACAFNRSATPPHGHLYSGYRRRLQAP